MIYKLISIAFLCAMITQNHAQQIAATCGDCLSINAGQACVDCFSNADQAFCCPHPNGVAEDCDTCPTPAPTTPAPTTPAPTTPAPTTPAPTTPAPTTPAPITTTTVPITTTTVTCTCPPGVVSDSSSSGSSSGSSSSDSSEISASSLSPAVTGLSDSSSSSNSSSESSESSSFEVTEPNGCICTTTLITTLALDDSSSGSGSNSSSSDSSSSEDILAAHVAGNVRDDILGEEDAQKVEDNEGEAHYTMTINFDDFTLMNVWGLFGVLMVANMLCCWLCQRKKERASFADQDEDGGARLDVLA